MTTRFIFICKYGRTQKHHLDCLFHYHRRDNAFIKINTASDLFALNKDLFKTLWQSGVGNDKSKCYQLED